MQGWEQLLRSGTALTLYTPLNPLKVMGGAGGRGAKAVQLRPVGRIYRCLEEGMLPVDAEWRRCTAAGLAGTTDCCSAKCVWALKLYTHEHWQRGPDISNISTSIKGNIPYIGHLIIQRSEARHQIHAHARYLADQQLIPRQLNPMWSLA